MSIKVSILSTSNRIPTRGAVAKQVVMYTSCWLLPWYYYCDIRLYYCDIRTTFISDNSTIWWNSSITQKTCNRKYTWLPFWYCPLVGILFEVVRIVKMRNTNTNVYISERQLHVTLDIQRWPDPVYQIRHIWPGRQEEGQP